MSTRYRIWPNLNYFYDPTTGTVNEAATEAARLATQNPGVKFMVLTVGGIVSVGAATWE